MADIIDQINALGKTTGVTVGGAASATGSNFRANTTAVQPKSNFWGSVGHTLATVPAQAAGAIYHATVDPFAHLISNAQNAADASKNAKSAEDMSTLLNKQSAQAKSDFQAGHISRADYIDKTHAISQAAQGQSQGVQGQQVKSIPQMLPDALSAIATVGTLGAGGLAVDAAKAGATAVGTRVAGATGAKVAGKVVQAGADLIGAGKGLGKNVVTQLPGKIVRNAAVTQPTVQLGTQTAQDVGTGNVPGIATDAALLAAPAGLGLAAKGIKAVAPGIRDAMLGKSATLTDAFGVKSVQDFMAGNANNPDAINTLKQMEMFTESQPAVQSGKISAGAFLAQHFASELHVDPKTTPLSEIVAKFGTYAKNDAALQDFLKTHPQGANVVLSHDFTSSLPTVVDRLQAVEGADANVRVKVANQALDELGIKNPSIRDKVGGLLLNGASAKEISQELKQNVTIPLPKGTLDKGYIATYGPKEIGSVPTKAATQEAGMPLIGSNPHGVLGAVGTALDKAGMGLKTTPTSVTRQAITDNLNQRLAGGKFDGQGKQIMEALSTEISKTSGIYDPRMLRATVNGLGPARASVENALRSVGGDVSQSDAKAVLQAVKGAYGDLPLGTRSLGEKLTDKLIEHVSPMAAYLKVQGYGKFSANPAFWVKQATKAEFIGQAETGGKALNLGRMMNSMLGTAPSNETIKLLENSGVTSKIGAAGNEADALGTQAFGLHGSDAQVNTYIKQSMGQAAEQFAKNNDTTVKDLVDSTHPLHQEFSHLMEMIVGYPKGDNILNTNLAKTLNVLVFPSRFETKVGMATAKYFMAQPKVVQLAMVNSLLRANAWANSPDGQKFQKDNANVIGALNYFSPTHTLDSIANFAKTGNAGDLGQVGGLPVGVITTILKHQGVNLPNFVAGEDINPATGQPYTNKVPTTDKARLQQGVTDLIGSMFSYPGATLGAPSKTSVIQGIPGLKIAKNEQKTVGPTSPTPSTSPSVPRPPSTISNPTRTITPGAPKVTPIYRGSSTPRVKHYAMKPANSKL